MIWLDAHLNPRLPRWLEARLQIEAAALRDIGLREAEDREVFRRAREVGAVLLTKARDFVDLVRRLGFPPKVIWLRCGNISEERLRQILARHLGWALETLQAEDIVEIR